MIRETTPQDRSSLKFGEEYKERIEREKKRARNMEYNEFLIKVLIMFFD